MGSGWIVAGGALVVALAAVAAIGLRCRALRLQLAEQTRRHDVTIARLRGELSASVADAARARAEVDTARAAVSGALLESGRLQQRLRETRAAMVERSVHDEVVAARDGLEHERDGLRRELRTLAPVVEELAAHRGYVESLQRELLLRDEQVLALEDARSMLAVGRAPGGADDAAVIDLTEAPADPPAGHGSGQRGQLGLVEPGVEQVVEGSASNR